MKFLILAALVAVAAADFHDDVFHFSTTGSVSGLQKSSAVAFQASPVYSQQYFKQVAQPVYSQQYYKQDAQPVYSQQYYQQIATPVYSQQIATPVYSQQYSQQIATPVYSQQYYKQIAKPVISQYSVKKVAEPIVYAAKPVLAKQYSAIPAFEGVSTYANAYNGPQYRILSHVQESDPSGPYKVSFDTENGIHAEEQGALVAGSEGAAVAAQGSYSYTGPDGVQYTVNYIADENGFRAAGDHLPTPPPVPAEILKSLEENARSGEQYDDQGRLLKK